MARTRCAAAIALSLASTAGAAEYHVATSGTDSAAGARAAPFRTIQRAAEAARPGDTITVHAGLYRERVNPPRGGRSDVERIVYQAAPGETVEIRGSEIVKGWTRVVGDVWKAEVPAAVFGAFNPFADEIHGDWFDPKGRKHHTGAVYLDGDWLVEAVRKEDVLQDAPSPLPGTPTWFAEVGEKATTVWAQFPGKDPNEHLVEVNVRQTIFYPDAPGRNYITVRGFAMRQAATPWAPPTAEQIGLVGTHWSKGWVIENNTISHSISSGISLGKHGDRFDNTSADTAEGYVETIRRAQAHPIPWTKEGVGGHVVRNNRVSHCEQAGIVGSMGPAFSIVTGNTIHDIHVRALFTGAEMAGIKFHGAIDAVIEGNHVYRTVRGLWLDWMAQGTRVSRNLFHDNRSEDLFLEVNHGPFVVDNNVFLSATNVLDVSEGGAFVHNLFVGRIVNAPEPNRETPFHPAHSTTVAGLVRTRGGDHRFFNNVFVGRGDVPVEVREANWLSPRSGYGLQAYDGRPPLQAGGNVYLGGAKPWRDENGATVLRGEDPGVYLVEERGRFSLHLNGDAAWLEADTKVVTTASLGLATVAKVSYENADGSPLVLDRDYFGMPRDPARPTPGPFEQPGRGVLTLTLR